MALTTTEILAFIFVLGILFKILVVGLTPESWLKAVKIIYKRANVLFVTELILAGLVLYILLTELSLAQIMASVLFGALLTGMTFAIYSKELVPMMSKIFQDKKMMKRSLLPILLWLGLAIGLLVKIFLF